MKLSAIWQNWKKEATAVLKQFPLGILSGIVFTIAAWQVSVNDYYWVFRSDFVKLMLMALWGFFIFANGEQLLHNRKAKPWIKVLTWCGVLMFLAGYYWLGFPTGNLRLASDEYLIRYAVLTFALVVALMLVPLILRQKESHVWKYNYHLWSRVALTGLLGIGLFIGLMIFIGALEVLFKIHIPGYWPENVFFGVVGLICVPYFLGGAKAILANFKKKEELPTAWKLLGKFIILPLTILYFLVLYAYSAKILITGEWPNGWVAPLVLFFSAVGLGGFLIFHEIIQNSSERWLKNFVRAFWIILIPMIGMLFWSLSIRIGEYGITESRYLVLVYGGFLAIMAGYFLFSQKQRLSIFFSVLFILTLFSAFGPWGMFQISENSQINRLQEILERNKILVAGQIQKAPEEVSIPDKQEISAIIHYLEAYHDLELVYAWFPQEPAARDEVFVLMGFSEYDSFAVRSRKNRYFFDIDKAQDGYEVNGYDYLTDLWVNLDNEQVAKINENVITYKLRPNNKLEINYNNQESLTIDVSSWAQEVFNIETNQNPISPENRGAPLKFDFESENLKIRFLIERAELLKQEDSLILQNLRGVMLVDLK